jgi:hypothetical protein
MLHACTSNHNQGDDSRAEIIHQVNEVRVKR